MMNWAFKELASNIPVKSRIKLNRYSTSYMYTGFSPEIFLHLVQNEQMSVGKRITHGADKFTLGACHVLFAVDATMNCCKLTDKGLLALNVNLSIDEFDEKKN